MRLVEGADRICLGQPQHAREQGLWRHVLDRQPLDCLVERRPPFQVVRAARLGGLSEGAMRIRPVRTGGQADVVGPRAERAVEVAGQVEQLLLQAGLAGFEVQGERLPEAALRMTDL